MQFKRPSTLNWKCTRRRSGVQIQVCVQSSPAFTLPGGESAAEDGKGFYHSRLLKSAVLCMHSVKLYCREQDYMVWVLILFNLIQCYLLSPLYCIVSIKGLERKSGLVMRWTWRRESMRHPIKHESGQQEKAPDNCFCSVHPMSCSWHNIGCTKDQLLNASKQCLILWAVLNTDVSKVTSITWHWQKGKSAVENGQNRGLHADHKICPFPTGAWSEDEGSPWCPKTGHFRPISSHR